MGEGNKKLVTLGHFQVLINFDKHYNKWKICEENNHPWHLSLKKWNILFLASMEEKYDIFGLYIYLIPIKIQDWNIRLIYVIIDASMIPSVKDLLYSEIHHKF